MHLIGTISVKTFVELWHFVKFFSSIFLFPSEFWKSVSHKNEIPYLQMMKTCVATEAIVKIFARIIYMILLTRLLTYKFQTELGLGTEIRRQTHIRIGFFPRVFPFARNLVQPRELKDKREVSFDIPAKVL
jgi:hypothetical protein